MFIGLSVVEMNSEEIDYPTLYKSYKKHTHKQIKKINNNILQHLDKKSKQYVLTKAVIDGMY